MIGQKRVLRNIFSKVLVLFAFTYISIFIFSIPQGYSWEIIDGRFVSTYPLYMIIKRCNNTFISLLEFNLGYNMKGKALVEILFEAFKKTALLLLSSIVLAFVLGLLKGISDSSRGNKNYASFKVLTSVMPISMPDVLIAAMMQSFAIWLIQRDIHIFKVAGSGTLAHSFLPIIALSILPAFYIARITSLAVNDCYKKPYVITALGKGCSSMRILWNHVMRNAIKSIVEGLPNITSIIISNTLIVEYMFSYPGLTTSLMNHITMGDRRSSAIIIVFIGSFYFILNGLFHCISKLMNISYRREAI